MQRDSGGSSRSGSKVPRTRSDLWREIEREKRARERWQLRKGSGEGGGEEGEQGYGGQFQIFSSNQNWCREREGGGGERSEVEVLASFSSNRGEGSGEEAGCRERGRKRFQAPSDERGQGGDLKGSGSS